MASQSSKDIQAEITRLETILSSGATSVTQDGQTTTFDHDSIRKQIRDLKRKLADVNESKKSRPPILTINLQ